jgi:hypothetical protein
MILTMLVSGRPVGWAIGWGCPGCLGRRVAARVGVA